LKPLKKSRHGRSLQQSLTNARNNVKSHSRKGERMLRSSVGGERTYRQPYRTPVDTTAESPTRFDRDLRARREHELERDLVAERKQQRADAQRRLLAIETARAHGRSRGFDDSSASAARNVRSSSQQRVLNSSSGHNHASQRGHGLSHGRGHVAASPVRFAASEPVAVAGGGGGGLSTVADHQSSQSSADSPTAVELLLRVKLLQSAFDAHRWVQSRSLDFVNHDLPCLCNQTVTLFFFLRSHSMTTHRSSTSADVLPNTHSPHSLFLPSFLPSIRFDSHSHRSSTSADVARLTAALALAADASAANGDGGDGDGEGVASDLRLASQFTQMQDDMVTLRRRLDDGDTGADAAAATTALESRVAAQIDKRILAFYSPVRSATPCNANLFRVALSRVHTSHVRSLCALARTHVSR
jgi:hypothetical protein